MTNKAIESGWKVIPGLKSRDIQGTVDFYTKQLHFNLGGMHPDAYTEEGPPVFSSVYVGAKAAVNIYHALCEPDEFVPGWVWIAMGTSQLDEYYEELVKAGEDKVSIVEKIEDKPWGYRQFSIKDNDGNKLTFFRFLEGGNPGNDDEAE